MDGNYISVRETINAFPPRREISEIQSDMSALCFAVTSLTIARVTFGRRVSRLVLG